MQEENLTRSETSSSDLALRASMTNVSGHKSTPRLLAASNLSSSIDEIKLRSTMS